MFTAASTQGDIGTFQLSHLQGGDMHEYCLRVAACEQAVAPAVSPLGAPLRQHDLLAEEQLLNIGDGLRQVRRGARAVQGLQHICVLCQPALVLHPQWRLRFTGFILVLLK